ncbi:STAS/SEC14 domain-containing protein [Martelella endophytica]|uniref:STAS/SEC14 domain-containing protein n=1 Tax=Martelella endophytica TaxID=1486262 RepID=A0A0D5LQS8_MAREN|nr:STAS/SEC14 domain-containing protein [Martelella endophytica]AJY46117.1 hypothetical protein TM49_11215 [Martelella endophytica]
MLTKIEDLSEDITGFAIHGAMTAEDFQGVLMPALEARNVVGPIRLLLITASDFLGVDGGSAVGGQHFRRSEPLNLQRIALVTANYGFAQAVQMFAMLSHAEVKIFASGQDEQAIAWLEG